MGERGGGGGRREVRERGERERGWRRQERDGREVGEREGQERALLSLQSKM